MSLNEGSNRKWKRYLSLTFSVFISFYQESHQYQYILEVIDSKNDRITLSLLYKISKYRTDHWSISYYRIRRTRLRQFLNRDIYWNRSWNLVEITSDRDEKHHTRIILASDNAESDRMKCLYVQIASLEFDTFPFNDLQVLFCQILINISFCEQTKFGGNVIKSINHFWSNETHNLKYSWHLLKLRLFNFKKSFSSKLSLKNWIKVMDHEKSFDNHFVFMRMFIFSRWRMKLTEDNCW